MGKPSEADSPAYDLEGPKELAQLALAPHPRQSIRRRASRGSSLSGSAAEAHTEAPTGASTPVDMATPLTLQSLHMAF